MRLVAEQYASAGPGWNPLIEGSLRDRTAEAIDAIADALAEPGAAAEDPSFAGGSAGIAVFFSYLADAYQVDGFRDVAALHLRDAKTALAQTRMGPSLYSGFTGIAWAIHHLNNRLPGSGHDPLGPIDDALLHYLERSPWDLDYDLISGLVGIGVYALERLPAPASETLLSRVLDRLEETAERTEAGITWASVRGWIPAQWRDLYPERYYNLGVAHGMPAVIGLLGAISAAGIENDRTNALLDASMAWMLAQKLDDPGACFPRWVADGEEPVPARSAWCYGDPGVASALLVAARGAARPSWEKEAAKLAQRAAARPEGDAGVVDATICHGAAGLAHLFNRMHQTTEDPALAVAATRWVERTLEFRTHPEGVAGFAARMPDDTGNIEWHPDPGFLTGAAGIGLALLAATTPVEPAWDRMLLASARPARPALQP
jgi:lantibiotic modifying enzyme